MRDFIYRFRPLEDYYGEGFKSNLRFLMQSREWSRDRIREYKFQRLKALLQHAESKVPYYRELFRQNGIKSADINSLDDFKQIPPLSKNQVRDNIDYLKAEDFDSHQPVVAATSGTTGNITTVFRSRKLEDFRKAAVWRLFSENGINPGDRRVHINHPGPYVENAPLFEYDRVENVMSIHLNHVFKRNIAPLIEAIREFKPSLIYAHPCVFGVIAEYGVDHDIEPIEVPVVITYSEFTEPHMKSILHRMFPGKYIDYYGNRENTIAAWGNCDGKFYEISEYCHLEMESGDEEGDILSTSLHNFAFPMIRYRVGDYIRWIGDTDPEVPYPQFELIGARGKNLLLSRKGLTNPYIIHYLEINKMNKLKRYQLEQIDLDNVIIRIVPGPEYNRERDEARMLELIHEGMHGMFKVRLEYVDDIPFTKAGKYQWVKSKLADDYLAESSERIE
jgi:phenylacetate-CoA ligase